MKINKTNFKDLVIIDKSLFLDNRGYFYRDFCTKILKKLNFKIKQINFSFNKKKYTLRGFHFQKKPYEEDKIITCVKGEMLNVSIDLRKNSKTFQKVYKVKLNEKNNKSIYVPKGFANAFLTLKNNTKIIYYMSEYYNPSKADAIRYNDRYFNISWPHKPEVISKKDKSIKDYEPK